MPQKAANYTGTQPQGRHDHAKDLNLKNRKSSVWYPSTWRLIQVPPTSMVTDASGASLTRYGDPGLSTMASLLKSQAPTNEGQPNRLCPRTREASGDPHLQRGLGRRTEISAGWSRSAVACLVVNLPAPPSPPWVLPR